MDNNAKNNMGKDLFEAMGAGELSDTEKGALFAKMMEVVQGRAIARLGDEMSEEDRVAIISLIESGEDEAVEKFLSEKAPNFDLYLEEEAKKLRQELLIEFSDQEG